MKKIMFNEVYGLEKAVLLKIKDMTRRDGTKVFLQWELGIDTRIVGGRKETLQEYAIRKSPFKVGDVVAVAQRYEDVPIDMFPDVFFVDNILRQSPGWSNKMYVRAEYMPHHIKITDVRYEQLHCISEEECMREGIIRRDDLINCHMEDIVRYTFENSFEGGLWKTYKTPREAFAALIDKVSGKGTWDSNPFVYVITFKLR